MSVAEPVETLMLPAPSSERQATCNFESELVSDFRQAFQSRMGKQRIQIVPV